MPLISIITVNYNQAQATIDLLTSIKLHGCHFPLEIILVDNGSLENKELDYMACCKDIKFIRSKKNLGFAAGNNLGIQQATGKYLFLVNNDTEFTTGLVDTLVQTMEAHPEVGIISPMIKYEEQRDVIQYAGFTPMNYYTCRNECIGQFEIDKGQYQGLMGPTGYCHGAAMMISRTAMEKAGVMAENFFLYYEEMDWCEKIKKAGFQVWVNTTATIYHKESLAVGKNSALKEYFMNRNRILFIRRNANLIQRCFFYLYFLSFVATRNVLKYSKEKNYSYINILLRAIGWNIQHGVNSKYLGYTIK
ncbi:GT2 family glycosyltransferase [Pedobacter sp. CAN_A7]|uniref:glycosyltransferase family 2 protein n=1 Tax=Pedobacter sp. CAN_A7 TaxID=2787722 RepID=UPI0018C981B5